MSSKRSRQIQRLAQDSRQVISQTQSFSSPYPLPNQLEAFERFAPGSAQEVIATSQESIRFQQRMHELTLTAEIARDTHMNNTVRILLILAVSGAFVLAYFQRDLKSYGVLFTCLATLVGAVLSTRKHQ